MTALSRDSQWEPTQTAQKVNKSVQKSVFVVKKIHEKH